MNPENYDQITVSKEILGDMAVYLQEGMECIVSMHGANPIAIELPQRVTLEIVDTEPTVKGQTASSSYKPAMLSNGVRTMVPHTSPPVPRRDHDCRCFLRGTREGLILKGLRETGFAFRRGVFRKAAH